MNKSAFKLSYFAWSMKNIKIKKYSGKGLAEAGQIIISNRLYVNTWTMRDLANEYKRWARVPSPAGFSERYSTDIVFIAHDADGKPIAAAIYNRKTVNTFVRKIHRRKGIGTLLVKKVVAHAAKCRQTVESFDGIKGSEKFYRGMGMKFDGIQM